jgi:hypothetical protein
MSVPAARLIYHPRRERRAFRSAVVYFDSTAGNQDPYVWNEAFLHSYCHITQFHAEAGDINLWVCGDRFPQFSQLYCDLVFVVATKCPWHDANDLRRDDPIVDSDEAWVDHYRWYAQHPLTRRSRHTLKADPERSFQAQTGDGNLIDIVPLLQEQGIGLPELRAGMHAGTGSQPMTIAIAAAEAVAGALQHAPVIITGPELRKIRLDYPDLASPAPAPARDVPVTQITEQGRHCIHCGC